MKQLSLVPLYAFLLVCLVISDGNSSEETLPVIGGKKVVAMVNNEPVTSEEFGKYLSTIEHSEMGSENKAKEINYAEILDRLINEKLFLQEARNIGIDELPEVKATVDEYAKKNLAKLLVRQRLKDVVIDSAVIEQRLQDVTAEYKMTAVVFKEEPDARAMEEEIASGTSFDDAVKKAVDSGKTIESMEGKSLKKMELVPEISDVISTMKTGTVSPVVPFEKGYMIARLEDIRFPDDPDMRERIRGSLLKDQRQTVLDEYTQSLIKEYVTIDEKLFGDINYDVSVEEFNKLLKDRRILARVRGDEPVRVKDLSEAFQKKFYHGVEDWMKKKLLNSKKDEVMRGLLEKTVMVLEAKKQGVDKTDEYKDRVEQFQRTILFEQFLSKVVTSDIRLTEDELRTYYNEHPDSYTSPEMIRIDSLVFNSKEQADNAFQTLRSGTEFKWLKENSEGQVGSDAQGVLNFSGRVLSVKMLPEGLQKALSGVSSGDFRLFAGPEDGYFYVLYAEEVFPPSKMPYQDVKDQILTTLYNEKVRKAVEEWSGKLKTHYPVEIYLKEF